MLSGRTPLTRRMGFTVFVRPVNPPLETATPRLRDACSARGTGVPFVSQGSGTANIVSFLFSHPSPEPLGSLCVVFCVLIAGPGLVPFLRIGGMWPFWVCRFSGPFEKCYTT